MAEKRMERQMLLLDINFNYFIISYRLIRVNRTSKALVLRLYNRTFSSIAVYPLNNISFVIYAPI